MRFDVSEEAWAVIEPLLPRGRGGPKRADDRRVLNGIFYILRTGSPWRDLPKRYGPHRTVYNRYIRWARRGIWIGIFDALATQCEDALVFIDASIVKAYRASAGSKRGRWQTLLAAHAAVAPPRFMRL